MFSALTQAGLRWRAAIGGQDKPAFGRVSLATQFALACLGVLLVGAMVIGVWVAREVEHGVLTRSTAMTGLYVDSVIAEYLQPLVTHSALNDAQLATLDRLLTETPLGQQIVAFKVWSTDGEVLYSPNRSLVGRQFDVDSELARSLDGEVTARISDLSAPENEYERERWQRLIEVYIPVREQGTGRTIASVEFYQLPNEIERNVADARRQSWLIVSGVMVAMFVLLAGIVKRGSDTITSQERALRERVSEQARLLTQNARLHDRVLRAAGRTTALNEQTLRRISADLHDGPGQTLALALLRLDSVLGADAATGVADCDLVRDAVQDALREIRAISAGLRLPELEPLTIRDVAERVLRDHQRRSGVPLETQLSELPEQAPLAVKIALFRSLQEALSNAVRHGGGSAVTVRVWAESNRLSMAVSDRGPGFLPERLETDDGLGLTGIRERAELLGGEFTVESAPGRGATVTASWPLERTGEA